MKYILSPADGERLVLGPPAAGELLIKALPPEGASGYAAGTMALQPGAFIPRCRCLQTDEVWFVYKGQGRVTVGTETATIVPGMVVHVPRATWHMFRNTGTGLLQLMLWAHPAGIDAFYREIAALGPTAALEAIAAAGRRYGIEFDAQAAVAEPPREGGGRSSRHRRRRGARRGERPVASTPVSPVPSASGAASPRQHPRPRRRSHHRGGSPPRAASETRPQPSAAAPAPVAPAAAPPVASGPVKEVYMNGRWVRVSGEGPVIAPGRERFARRREHRRRPPRAPS